MELIDFMPLVLYFLGATSLILLIIILFRVIKITEKVDLIVDDVYDKSQKLNGLFDFASKLELLNDRVANAIIKGIMNFFNKKRKGDDIDG